jgi:hypothetical protein
MASCLSVVKFLMLAYFGFIYFLADVLVVAIISCGSRVAQSLLCLTTDWTYERSRFDPRQRQRIFPLACVQISSEAGPSSCPVCAGGPFPGAKARPVRDADHSPPSSVVVEYE